MLLSKPALAALVASTLALSAGTTAAGAAQPDPSDRKDVAASDQLTREVLDALKRDLGLSEQQARQHGQQQAKAIELDARLRASLGAALAGTSYDVRTGKLVALVSDPDKVDDAEAGGADARHATRSKAELEAVKADLDARAGKAKGADERDRKPHGPRSADLDGVSSWFVDETSNTVHVTVEKAKADKGRASLAKYGDAVTVTESDTTPTPTVWMDGGDAINSATCSAGFNLRNRSTGQGYLLTAGHCVSKGSTLRGQYNYVFGQVLDSFFPGYDDAIAINQSGGSYGQGPWVDTNPSNGSAITVASYTDAPVGTTVCKSGITTRWTCGRITAKNETVTYDGTATVNGLTRHSACVEKGDSGGSVVSVTNVYAAEGVNSGAQLRSDGTRPRCLSVFGMTNVSWHFPVADSLAYYGPKYGVSLW